MAIQISQIAISQSFGVVIQRINDMADSFTANVVTTGALAGGAYTTGNAYVNGMFGSNVLYTTTLAGGNISTNTALLIASNTYVNNYLSVGNTTINAAFGYVTATQSIASFYASTNSYIQTTTTNVNTGPSASADWTAYNDIENGSVFIDMGVLSSTWSNTQWTIGGANDGYLYTGGGNLSVGTNSENKYINFFTGGGFTENERMRITGSGNVGIKNTNPDATLAVTGTANVSANVRIGGYTTVANSFSVSTIDSNLTPNTNNTRSLGNSTNRWASLYVSGSTIYLGTVSLFDSSGSLQTSGGAVVNGALSVNSSITGANTISVTGNATFSNTIIVTGNSTFGNTIAVTGNATFSNSVAVTGAVALANTITVTGATTLSNTIAVTGATTLSNTITVTGAATFSNSSAYTGPASFSNTITAVGNVTFGNTFFVNGAVTVNSSMNVVSNVQFANTLSVTGNVSFANLIIVTGAATLSNTISVTGAATLSNSIAITGAATLSNTISVTGAATFSNSSAHTGAATFGNTVAIEGAVTVNNSITANSSLSVNGAVIVSNNNLSIATSSGSSISVGDGAVNTVINSSSITVTNIVGTNIAGLITTISQPRITANNALFLNGNSAATLRSYTDTAYTNATSYADTAAATAYANSLVYAASASQSSYLNAQSDLQAAVAALNAGITSGSSNAHNLITGTVPSGRLTGSYTGVTAVGTLPTLSANVITSNSINVANSVSIGNSVIVTGNANVGGDLRVIGNMFISGTLAASQSAAGDIIPTSNGVNLGSVTKRFNVYAMTGNFAEPVTVSNSVTFGNTYPESNGRLFGNNTLRWTISANTIDCGNGTFTNASFANVTVSSNSSLNVATVNTVFITGVSSHTGNSSFASNTSFDANATFSGVVSVSNNVTITGNTSVSNFLSVNGISYGYSTKYNVTTTALQTADNFSATSYRSAEYIVQMTDSTNYQVSKLLVLHDGTTAYVTEYAQLYNNSLLGTFSADINSGNVRLRVTPTTGTVVVTLTRTSLVV
jgi:UDP-3-O-[3-hydroxymyristoyl] glucosamine N-acyltransferase